MRKSPTLQLANFNDFTGGLNLTADPFLLAPNETPDCLNVDVDARGGFRQRKGTRPISSTPLPDAVKSMWDFATVAGVKQILVHAGTGVYTSTGGSFTHQFNAGAGIARAASFNDKCYITTTAGPVPRRWDGTTMVTLTDASTAWSNDLEDPTGTSFPKAKVCASHVGVAWAANTVESGTAYPNRVRWSHPNRPEQWRSKDFIDIDLGVDGDEIVALHPFEDHLLIFKKSSVHALYGYNDETFQVTPVSQDIGVLNADAIVTTEHGVYVFSWPEGIFRYSRDGIEWLFERLRPLMDGDLSASNADQVSLGFASRRLWVSIPYRGSATRNRVFVLDMTVGEQGAWTAYDIPVGPFLLWDPPGTTPQFLAVHSTLNTVLKLDQNVHTDRFVSDDVPIVARYRTGFVDLGEPAIRKRWKRPQIVLKAGTSSNLRVQVYRDWDPTRFVRHFTIDTEADGQDDPTEDDDGDVVVAGGWDVGLWDTALWGALPNSSEGVRQDRTDAGSLLKNEIHRGSQLGSASAIALEFLGPTIESTWGVDSITFKFKPRKVR